MFQFIASVSGQVVFLGRYTNAWPSSCSAPRINQLDLLVDCQASSWLSLIHRRFEKAPATIRYIKMMKG